MVYRDSYFEIVLADDIIRVKAIAEYINDPILFEKSIKKRIEIQNGKTYPMLADIRKIKGGNLNLRKRLTGKDSISGVSALSIVCSSKFQISLFNYFNLKKILPMPATMYTSEEKALAWLENLKTGCLNNPNSCIPDNLYFKNDFFEIRIENGIVYVDWLKERYNTEHVDEIIKKRLELTKGYFFPVYTDFSKVNYGSRSAIRRLSSFDAFIGVIASATYCKSRVQQTLYRLFHVLFRPKVPNKFFTDKKAALLWLENFKPKNNSF